MLSSCHQNLPKMNTVPFKFQCTGVCLNCKIRRRFKITALCLTCIHCLTRDSSLRGRFNSLAAKNLGGSGRKDWPEALLSFWCVVKLKQTWVFLSSEQTPRSSCLCRIYPPYSGPIQTRALCTRYVQVHS